MGKFEVFVDSNLMDLVTLDAPKFEIGSSVEARWWGSRREPKWYPGKVTAVNRDGTVDIHFDDGDVRSHWKTNRTRLTGEPAKGCSGVFSFKLANGSAYLCHRRSGVLEVVRAHDNTESGLREQAAGFKSDELTAALQSNETALNKQLENADVSEIGALHLEKAILESKSTFKEVQRSVHLIPRGKTIVLEGNNVFWVSND